MSAERKAKLTALNAELMKAHEETLWKLGDAPDPEIEYREGEDSDTIEHLRAENERLKADLAETRAAILEHSECVNVCPQCGWEDPCADDDVCLVLKEVTP